MKHGSGLGDAGIRDGGVVLSGKKYCQIPEKLDGGIDAGSQKQEGYDPENDQ